MLLTCPSGPWTQISAKTSEAVLKGGALAQHKCRNATMRDGTLSHTSKGTNLMNAASLVHLTIGPDLLKISKPFSGGMVGIIVVLSIWQLGQVKDSYHM